MIRISRWVVALVFYLLMILTIMTFRPSLMFDQDGNPKPFGTGLKEGKSVFAPAFVFPLLGVLSYFMASTMYVVYV